MGSDNTRDTDLVLAPNEFVFVSDSNTGLIKPIVGPTKKTLDSTEQPVIFDSSIGKFLRVSAKEAVQLFPVVDERSYLILENPTVSEDKPHPTKGQDNSTPPLRTGQKQNIPGPQSFPLWPGQVANVIQGHQLRSNQYLKCVVHNAKEAMENWGKAVIDTASVINTNETDGPSSKKENKSEEWLITQQKANLVTGKILIIKGTEVSYYIPPTGINVVRDEQGEYVRDAVTLERLEYCILLDESGDKRYVRGPDVVFPKPTEAFVCQGSDRKFKAIELNDDMGIYIKVIADYEGNKAGDELFITGKEQKIYYPREEHAIIKYSNQIRHYAVAIPKGEARYVLNKTTGEIDTVKGPLMFLPDPREKVIVKRVLTDKEVSLWFPGNEKALEHNRVLREQTTETREDYVRSMSKSAIAGAFASASPMMNESSVRQNINYAGDDLKRGTSYTKPRSITIDSKYEGAVNINVWPGYAVQVISKNGKRRVVIGPESVILEYDESLEVMELSTGKPKDDHDVLRTVYLCVKNNRVSDIIDLVTKDMINVRARVNYRVNFESEPVLWFSVDNYVKFLTQNLRSIIRNTVQKYDIDDVFHNIASIIRDVILGPHIEGKERTGRSFPENGMKVYDVEILGTEIGDPSIKERLMRAQYDSVQAALDIARVKQNLLVIQETEKCNRESMSEKSQSNLKLLDLSKEEQDKKDAKEKAAFEAEKIITTLRSEIADIDLATTKKKHDESNEHEKKQTAILIEAFERKFKAMTPDLISALEASGNKALAASLAEHIPQAGGGVGLILGQKLLENIIGMVKGTPMESALKAITEKA